MMALASDIDGTLVFNQQIKKQDKEAIEKYQKKHHLAMEMENLFSV